MRSTSIRLIAIAWAAAVAGDVTSLYLGRRLGRTFLVRHGPKVGISEERLHVVERFFDRHGGKAILLGRFVGLVRAIAPFLAGSSGMSLRRFLPYDIIGAGLWASTFILLGYLFWASFDRVVHYAEQGALALGTTIVVIVGLTWAVRWMREEENRRRLMRWTETQAQRPALRPLVVVARPVVALVRRPAMFVWRRLTPGELGLEVTTLLAVLGVAAFTFFANARVAHRVGVGIFDADGLRLADRLANDTVIDIVAVATHLGSLPVVSVLVLVTAAFLLWRREPGRAAVLVLGTVVSFILVHVLKDIFDRPAPRAAARGRRPLRVPVRARHVRRGVGGGGARADARDADDRRALRLRHRVDRDRGVRGGVARLPARALPLRRVRGARARGRHLRAPGARRAGHRARARR